MRNPLPLSPSLENLKKQAKTLLKLWQAGDVPAIARIRAVHPHPAEPRLTDCQLVLAREAGFDSWRELRTAVESANRTQADQFVDLACLCFDDPHHDHRSFHTRAREMLKENPSLASANIWCAASAGNVQAIREFLIEQPALVNQPGVHGWTPLICACYSRVASTYEAAKLLLDLRADPNTYTMKGNADTRLDQTSRRFTALSGVFGGGSTGLANQPRHPQWRALGTLLLERGADPSDEEALHHGRDEYLEICVALGKRPNDGLLARELARASRAGRIETVKLLLSHHAPLDGKFDGRTAWEHATERGQLKLARLLEEAGAPPSELDPVKRFLSFCMAGEEANARAMLATDPDLVSKAPQDAVRKASETGRPEAVNLVIDLGFDPNWLDDDAALHGAAGRGDEAMVHLLLVRGASLTLREPWYDSTPVGWANFFDRIVLRDKLLDEGPICLFDALEFDRLDRIPDILARDPEALTRPFAKCLTREPKPEDWQTPLERMEARGKNEAARLLRSLLGAQILGGIDVGGGA